MKATQESYNEQFKQITDIQARSVEPLRIFGGLAADTLEQVIRKNYAVMGDLVEFTVKQSQLPLSGENAGELVSAQAAEFNAFGELMNARATEYAEMANEFGDRARKATEEASASARDVTEKATAAARKITEDAAASAKEAIEEGAKSVEKASKSASKAAA